MEWIEEALACTGTASIRKRRLPAEQVVWLVIALALFCRTSMSEVLESLDLVLPNGGILRRHSGQPEGFQPLPHTVMLETSPRGFSWLRLPPPRLSS